MEKTTVLKTLPANRRDALRDLHINPTHKLKADESPAFLLYLNYAVNNICDITGIDPNLNNPEKIPDNIRSKGPEAIRKLANFFWLFNVEDPKRDFRDYEKYTLAIAGKIYELRNYFAHLDKSGVDELVVNHDMFVFLDGVLATDARNSAVKPGLRTAKIFNLSLFAKHNREQKTFEFTRRGLIFFISLALYRDDAIEFTQCLEDMKLPKCPKGKDVLEECTCVCEKDCASKPSVAKALIAMMTYFSARRGRSVNLLEDDGNYLAFADICGYLNKVPAEAMNHLLLQNENDRLRKLADKSTESEENKLFKYTLHRRDRDRFLSLAAGACEDFNYLPCVRFKRLDISDHEGRKKYVFGVEQDNRIHLDRHFHIRDNAIRFEFKPTEHYGSVHIDSLRSCFSAHTMKQLLLAKFIKQDIDSDIDIDIDEPVAAYFTAYHRILENIINTEDPNDMYVEDGTYLKDFSTVSGYAPEAIAENLSLLKPFFPENVIRFFSGDETLPDDKALRDELDRTLRAKWNHASDFLARLEKFNFWKQELGEARKKDPEARIPKPVCTKDDVQNPPRECKFSDATMIAWVFRYLNLHLPAEKKFRQLPRGEQHREGITDHEYQIVHSIIGRYSLDPKGLSSYITRQRPELAVALSSLNSAVSAIRKAEEKRRPPERDKYGRRKRVTPSLNMLAQAAAECCINFYDAKLKVLSSLEGDRLKQACRQFGIKTGLAKDKNGIIKSILRIDLAKWINAFDTEKQQKYENRSLDQTGHVVSQIPFPNEFAQRIMLATDRQSQAGRFIVKKEDGTEFFDFNAAFRNLTLPVQLRDYYDTAPLIHALLLMKKHQDIESVPGLKLVSEFVEYPPDLSKNALDKAVRTIKDVHNQDKVLAFCAMEYWNRFQSSGSFVCSRKEALADNPNPSIADFFAATVTLAFSNEDSRRILLQPNDVNRPLLSQIQENAAVIAKFMDPEGKCQEYDFYEMMKTYRIIQAQDRAKRLKAIPLIVSFANAVNIPDGGYYKLNKKGKLVSKTSEEKRAMEFQYYHGRFPKLTEEEYNQIADGRNLVFHRGIGLDLEPLIALLQKYIHITGK